MKSVQVETISIIRRKKHMKWLMLMSILLTEIFLLAQNSQNSLGPARPISNSTGAQKRTVAADVANSAGLQPDSGNYKNLQLLRSVRPAFSQTASSRQRSSATLKPKTQNLSPANWYGIRIVDGKTFKTISAAENDLAGKPGLVMVPSIAAAGAGQSLLHKDNITVWDFRGGANPNTFNTQLHFNVKDIENGGVRQKMILFDALAPAWSMRAGSSSASFEAATFLEGNLHGAGVLEALNGTVVVDAGATDSSSVVVGVEGTAQVQGTRANTISDLRGGTFNASVSGEGDVTTATGLYAQAPSNTGSGRIRDAVSFHAENPTVGTSTNKSIQSDGQVQIGTAGGVGAGGSASLLTIVTANNGALSWQSTAGSPNNRVWDAIANASDWQLRRVSDDNSSAATAIDCSGVNVSVTQCLFPTGIKIGSNGTLSTSVQHKRISTGPIAAMTRTEVLLNWAATFNDTNYTVTCNVEDSTTAAGAQGLTFERLRTKSATQVGLVINNPTGGAITGAIDCIAHHD
jgi:hypothetical protein